MDVYEPSVVCACSQWNHPRESTRRERCSFIVSGGHQQSRDSDRISGGGQGTNRGGEFADDKQDMSKPGQKGGQASGGQQSRKPDQSPSGGRDSNVADDDSSDMGRKDGGMSGGGGHNP